jgi:hypothetical protein
LKISLPSQKNSKISQTRPSSYHRPIFELKATLLEKITAGMAEKARGGNFLLVPPYCRKFSALTAVKYGFQFMNFLLSEF